MKFSGYYILEQQVDIFCTKPEEFDLIKGSVSVTAL